MDVGTALAVLEPARDAATTATARARGLRVLADDVRRLARRVAGTTEVDWRSGAAEAFRREVHLRARAAADLAGQLDVAADELERHAAVVTARVGAVEEAVLQTPELVRDLGGALAGRVADVRWAP